MIDVKFPSLVFVTHSFLVFQLKFHSNFLIDNFSFAIFMNELLMIWRSEMKNEQLFNLRKIPVFLLKQNSWKFRDEAFINLQTSMDLFLCFRVVYFSFLNLYDFLSNFFFNRLRWSTNSLINFHH